MNLQALHEKVRKLYFSLFMLVSVFAGILLIIFYKRMGDATRDIGISLVIAGTVGLGVEFYNRQHGEALLAQLIKDAIQSLTGPKFEQIMALIQHDSLRALGVRRVFLNRLQQDFTDYITKASPECEIRLLGISMSKLAQREVQDLLVDRLKRGCRIKWLLLDPNSDVVEKRAESEGQTALAFKRDVESWSALHQLFIQSLPSELRERIELRHYADFPCYFLVDNGAFMLVGSYLRSCRGEEVPHLELEIKEGGAYKPFRKHFESLWAAAAARKTLPFEDRRRVSVPVVKERRRNIAQVA